MTIDFLMLWCLAKLINISARFCFVLLLFLSFLKWQMKCGCASMICMNSLIDGMTTSTRCYCEAPTRQHGVSLSAWTAFVVHPAGWDKKMMNEWRMALFGIFRRYELYRKYSYMTAIFIVHQFKWENRIRIVLRHRNQGCLTPSALVFNDEPKL